MALSRGFSTVVLGVGVRESTRNGLGRSVQQKTGVQERLGRLQEAILEPFAVGPAVSAAVWGILGDFARCPDTCCIIVLAPV